MDGLEDRVFAGHIVGFRGHRAERRPAKHVFARRRANQVCEVRMATGKLLDLDSPLRVFELVAQVLSEDRGVQFLARSDGCRIRHRDLHIIKQWEYCGVPPVWRKRSASPRWFWPTSGICVRTAPGGTCCRWRV